MKPIVRITTGYFTLNHQIKTPESSPGKKKLSDTLTMRKTISRGILQTFWRLCKFRFKNKTKPKANEKVKQLLTPRKNKICQKSHLSSLCGTAVNTYY